jgi:hypothetical protein
MTGRDTNNRETGARILKESHGPDPRDAFSQKAAENRKPASGMGLTQPADEPHDKTRQSDSTDQPVKRLTVKRWGTKRRHSL